MLGGAGTILLLLARSDGSSAVDKFDRGAYDSAKTKYTIGAVGAGIGGALAVAGLVFVLSSPSPQGSSVGLVIAPRVDEATKGVWLRGSF